MRAEYDFSGGVRGKTAARYRKGAAVFKRIENHPEFLRRVSEGRADFAAGRSRRLEDIPD